jgi:type I restriction enzyme, S subunit
VSKWEMVKLKKLCQTTQGVQIPLNKQIDNSKPDYIRYLYISDFKVNTKQLFVKDIFPSKVVTENDLVMANTGSPGAVFKGKYGVLSNNLFKISFDNNVLFNDYLYLYLVSSVFQNKLQSQMKGGIQRHLGHKTIGEQMILLPPFETQKLIAKTLNTAAELIAMRKQQLAELDNLITSIFYDMFGDPVENPKKWSVKALSEITESFIGLTYKPEDVSETGIVVLRSSNIQNDSLDFKDVVRVNKVVKRKLIVQPGDILMCSRNGSKRLVGKAALIQNSDEEMTFGAFMTIIRSNYNVFLITFFRSTAFRNQLFSSETTTINQITKSMLDKIVVPLPPIDLQNQFAHIVTKIEEQKNLVKKAIHEAQHLFDSLMSDYFE